MAPGDVLGLISDGIYEYEDAAGQQFGEEGVANILRRHHQGPMPELVDIMMRAVHEHGGPVPQADDITIVLVRRLPE